MTTFGISTILGWDLDALSELGTDLGLHSTDVRQCFADFRGSSDLSQTWRGDAADASTQHANDLATDLYDLADTIGLMGDQVLRRQADLVEARDTIIRTRNVAQDNGFVVADDGSVKVGPPAPHEPRNAGDNSELLSEASQFATTLQQAIRDAAAADLDLARALRAAAETVQTHAKDQEVVVEAVGYIPPVGPVAPGTPGQGTDPFLTDVTILGPTTPRPGDPDFAMYWDALTDEERAAAVNNWGGVGKDFDPFDGVKGGQLPSWAQVYNLGHNGGISYDKHGNPVVGKGYGYVGGGSVTGPDGSQWPIVSPYYSDGKHVYTSDSGVPRSDGGINTLDGNDPGWHTVETYQGPGHFGTVSQSTKAIIFGENLTGQEVEVNPVDSKDVSIGPDGQPVYGAPEHGEAHLPADKPYWDAKPPDHTEPEFNPTEAALGGNALALQGADGALQAHAAGEHGEREYSVSYQVNDDGRVRAVVNTYTSGPNHDGGGTNVGGFATSFPDGKHGSASELPINVRHVESNYPHSGPVPDPKVHYLDDPSRNGELTDGTRIYTEKLDR